MRNTGVTERALTRLATYRIWLPHNKEFPCRVHGQAKAGDCDKTEWPTLEFMGQQARQQPGRNEKPDEAHRDDPADKHNALYQQAISCAA